MSKIALSIIVPCYKVEQYLPACLDSLMNQTLKNIEILCINDGSPDSCIDILHRYEQEYPGKIVIIDKKMKVFGAEDLTGYALPVASTLALLIATIL